MDPELFNTIPMYFKRKMKLCSVRKDEIKLIKTYKIDLRNNEGFVFTVTDKCCGRSKLDFVVVDNLDK